MASCRKPAFHCRCHPSRRFRAIPVKAYAAVRMTVDCVQCAAARGHVKRVTITPGTDNFLAISVKLSGPRPLFPIRVEIRVFNCVAKDKTHAKHIGAKSLRMVKYGL